MPVARQVTLPLAEWAELNAPLLQVEGRGAYIPLKPLCHVLLGVNDDKPQRQRIRHDPILSQLTDYLPVQTAGGTQEVLCLSWLGIGRWIDRLNLESVRELYRARILDIMWAITFAAYEIISGVRTLPSLITILPSKPLLVTLREEDAKQFLYSLAERLGRMELANRDMRALLTMMAGDSSGAAVCPCCGQPLDSSL
jgi:hypothetical protein